MMDILVKYAEVIVLSSNAWAPVIMDNGFVKILNNHNCKKLININ